MRAIAEEKFGGSIALMDLPVPEIGPGEVLIRVRAAGVNPFDWKVANRSIASPLSWASTPPAWSSGSAPA